MYSLIFWLLFYFYDYKVVPPRGAAALGNAKARNGNNSQLIANYRNFLLSSVIQLSL